MSYTSWFHEFAAKHKKIVDKLVNQGYNQEQIIEYFDFENMVEKENDFCPLYKENRKCHEMEKLNCYLCACPNFRFHDGGIKEYNGKKILSKCNINNGSTIGHKEFIHQDCSKCTVPHHKSYVAKHFDLDWKVVMHKCNLGVEG